jgi:CRISPR/Cas system-associated exonuclease Cas4 (RecB family)
VVRQARTAIAERGYHGWTGAMEPRAYSVTGLDRYLQCPFKYFAASVLRLEEEPERRPGLTPLERGRFEHEVFQLFFERWDASGRGAIDEAALETARAEFVAVVDEVISRLPPSERALERTRLLGSAVGSGLGERVFRFEAARPTPITERLLEYPLDGEYQLPVPQSEQGGEAESVPAKTRAVRLRATADRIDLLADGTMRVIDYKTGKASTAASSIQLPVYKLCAEERLDMHRGRHWRVSEAGYLAFGRPEPFVPVVSPGDEAQKKVTAAIARVAEVVDRIESGAFPVTPAEPHMCMFCGYAAVCRKDYVDDV